MILFREDYMEEEFEKLNDKLIRILNAMDAFLGLKHGCNMIITSIYREDLKSVHMYFRGADVSTTGMSHDECMYIGNIINLALPYGKENFQTVVYHDSGTGWHFHVQVKA